MTVECINEKTNETRPSDVSLFSKTTGGINVSFFCLANQCRVKMRTQEIQSFGIAIFRILRNPLPPEINQQVIQPCIQAQSSIIHEPNFCGKTTLCKINLGYPILL